jgi:hypothetical protein
LPFSVRMESRSQIINPGPTSGFTKLAQNARKIQHDLHPELDKKLRWGGYFGGAKGKYGAMDTMHFDLGGEHLGMAGGSWEGGLKNKNFPGAKSVPMGPVAQYKLPGKDQGAPPVAELPALKDRTSLPPHVIEALKTKPAPRDKEQYAAGLHDIRGHMGDIGRHARSLFGHPQHRYPDLLGNARKAGLLEQPAHKVTGSASLSVDFKNMPRGVKTKTKIDGMFSQIRVARGRAMPLASQDG